MVVLQEIDPALAQTVHEKNLIRQYDLLANCIEIGVAKGPKYFDKYTLSSLTHVAVATISHQGGRCRRTREALRLNRQCSTMQLRVAGKLAKSKGSNCADGLDAKSGRKMLLGSTFRRTCGR